MHQGLTLFPLQRDGLDQPILVNRQGFIISGHKRVAAHRLLGRSVIPGRIRDIPVGPTAKDNRDLDQSLIKLIRENTNRQNVGRATRLRIYHRIAPEFFNIGSKVSSQRAREIAEIIRVTEHSVLKDLAYIRGENIKGLTVETVAKEWRDKAARARVNLVDVGNGLYVCQVTLNGQQVNSGPGKMQEVLGDSLKKARSHYWSKEARYSAVGLKIRTVRKRLGLTQSGLAHVLGISQSYLAEVEKGLYESANQLIIQVEEYAKEMAAMR